MTDDSLGNYILDGTSAENIKLPKPKDPNVLLVKDYKILSETDDSITYSANFCFKQENSEWICSPTNITVPSFMKESLMREIEKQNNNIEG